MSIDLLKDGRILVIHLQEVLAREEETAEATKRRVSDQLNGLDGMIILPDLPSIIVDLQHVDRIDIATVAISLLLVWFIKKRGKKFVLCQAAPHIEMMLQGMGKSEIFSYCQTQDQAVAICLTA